MSAIPFGGIAMGINNANAVGSMQDVAGIDRSGFFNRATLNPNDTIGTTNIATQTQTPGSTYDYTVNLGGGLSKAGNTGITPREANMRLNMNNFDWAQEINARVAAEEAAAQAAAAAASVAPAYSGSSSSGSGFNTGGGSNYGNYTGGGSSWGGNPSSTISGGSGRTDGGFGW